MVNHGTGWVRMEYLVPARGADRLPHRVPHRDARHRPAAPRLRPLGAVGGRAAHAADRRAGRRPPRHGGPVRADEPAGARDAVRRPRRGGLRGHDRRRERARRRPRRQRRQGEAPDQHPLLDGRRARPARARTASSRSTRRSSSCARTSASRSRRSTVRLRKVELDKVVADEARAKAQGRRRDVTARTRLLLRRRDRGAERGRRRAALRRGRRPSSRSSSRAWRSAGWRGWSRSRPRRSASTSGRP